MGVPITVGVTGHRLIRAEDVPALRRRVRSELEKLMARCPNSGFVMLNSIAIGTDTLCAQEALALGIRLVCPLPMPVVEYRKDFSPADAAVFDKLLRQAAEVFPVPVREGAGRDECYRAAGEYVAGHSHVLLDLWDGGEGKPGGCGAAEIAEYMLQGSGEGDTFKAPNDGAVLHILTPRAGSGMVTDFPVRLLENEPGSLDEILRMTDMFNADAKKAGGDAAEPDPLLPEGAADGGDRRLTGLREVYRAADRLSMGFQRRYLRAMGWFSVFGVLLVLFFLFYDELECDLFLLCYGALLLIYVLSFVLVRRGGSHGRYLHYRMLSEALRTQYYLTAAGVDCSVCGGFTWTQKQEAAWVRETVSTLLAGGVSGLPVDHGIIKTAWIDGQFAYHRQAYKRDAGKHRRNERIASWMLGVSVILFALVFVLEFQFSGLMTAPLYDGATPAFFLEHSGSTFTLRSLLKIVLGGVSAVTAFLANYYGKLSFERKSADHRKMAALYRAAKERFEAGGCDRKELFRALAREEIIENGNWFSYCRENPPAFDI